MAEPGEHVCVRCSRRMYLERPEADVCTLCSYEPCHECGKLMVNEAVLGIATTCHECTMKKVNDARTRCFRCFSALQLQVNDVGDFTSLYSCATCHLHVYIGVNGNPKREEVAICRTCSTRLSPVEIEWAMHQCDRCYNASRVCAAASCVVCAIELSAREVAWKTGLCNACWNRARPR